MFDGIELKTFSDIADAMNFQYVVNAPKTGIKWTGVVSDIIQRETDFGVSHLFLTHDRANLMDYTPAVNNEYFCFVVSTRQQYGSL